MTRSCVMPLAAWVLLATFTWCSYAHTAHAAPVPPVAAALSSPSQGFGFNNIEDDALAQPEKRLLKYFHPGSQAWMDDGGDLYPISQEGSNRAYSDSNFRRFGREGPSFLRFGRSVNRQLNALSSDGCEGSKPLGINPSPSTTPLQPMTRTKQHIANRIESSEPREITSRRMKRAAAPNYNNYGSVPSYSPSSWARGFQPQQEIITVYSEDPQDVNKRAYDGNYLRFGKRPNEYPPSSSSESSGSRAVVVERAPKRAFLRFG